MGYSPWGRKELDTTERLTLSLCILSAFHGRDSAFVGFLTRISLDLSMVCAAWLVLNSHLFLVLFLSFINSYS